MRATTVEDQGPTTMIVRRFGAGLAEASASDTKTLGGKGANLCEMASMGLPVPPGFVIGVDAFHAWQEDGDLPETELAQALSWLEEASGRHFGGETKPLLVAVRSGAPVSMPGMLDTILNLSLIHI